MLAVGGAAATLTLVASCSGGNAPVTSSAPPPPTTKTLPYGGAPKVGHPLPASVLSGDPCQEALTSDQLKQILGISPQGKRDDTTGLGPACDWHNSDSGAAVGVSYVTEPHQGLSGVYANTKPQVKLWQELPAIQGYPAVGHASSDSKDFCQVSVGIRDDLTFDVSLGLSTAKIGTADPCPLAARVADMVVTNLRQKAGS
ncbi:DUF3558 domain-containing protein [Amycolatopsis sp. NPDC051903]|uniref:DUF3558 domain-containing protein n=1 Tax=Amycolatopsis sp. NPDC051903 TaxID=3363936 RepID=UPI00379CBC7B